MTPKREPRSFPKRPQTDIKIGMNFDAKTKRAGHGLNFRLWVVTAPQEAPQGARGGGPHGKGQDPRHQCGRLKTLNFIQIYKVYIIQHTK